MRIFKLMTNVLYRRVPLSKLQLISLSIPIYLIRHLLDIYFADGIALIADTVKEAETLMLEVERVFFSVGAPTLPSYRKATSVRWLTSIGVPPVVGVTGYGHLAWASAPYPPEDKALWATFSRRKTVIMLGLGRAPPMPRWSPGRSFRTGCPLSFLLSWQEPTGHTWAPSISCPNLWFLLFARFIATRAFLFVAMSSLWVLFTVFLLI